MVSSWEIRTCSLSHERGSEKISRSLSVELGGASELRTVIQVRRVAGRLGAAAERELTQRAEALNSRLLVRHAISPSCVDWIPLRRAPKTWQVTVHVCES